MQEEQLASELVSLLGAENVRASEPVRLAYAQDASRLEGHTVAVAWPRTVQQIVSIVKIAKKFRTPIVPRGAGTGLAGGAVPANPGALVLDFTRMDKLLNLDEKRKTCTVQPGLVVNDLNLLLEHYGLCFPVEPSSHKVATIGGTVACNAAGLRAMRHGKAASWVAGLTVVDGHGRVFTTNDPKDFAGAEGTTGIIAELQLKLDHIMRERSVSLLEPESLRDAVSKCAGLRGNPEVTAAELMDKTTSETLGLGRKLLLLVEYSNRQGRVTDPLEVQKLWDLREGAYPAVAGLGWTVIEDPAFDDDATLVQFMEYLEHEKIPFISHLALRIVHPCFKLGEHKEIQRMYEKVQELGGKISGEHGIGIKKKAYLPEDERAKQRKLKDEYDPDKIINPGKIAD